ncbi:MAG: peroxiredoxin-like family protein [Woeseiaceae bacterium]|jgi:peroxiredoxin
MLKSIFVSAYMMAAMIITVFAVRKLWISGDVITWGGVILTTAPFLVVLGWLMVLRNTARTSARFPSLIVLGIAGVTAATWGYTQGGSKLALELALAGLVAYLVYAYWYSSFRHRHSRQIEVGRFLPEFELKDISGYSVSSASLTQRPTIWIFYRGNWCPLCMAQIKELVAQYHQLQALGVRVALISPQPHEFTVGLAKKFDVAFHFLTDENNQAARVLGIANPHGLPMGMQLLGYASETVLPTVIITDTGGRILWKHETDNYRVRPEPETYLAVLREHHVVA